MRCACRCHILNGRIMARTGELIPMVDTTSVMIIIGLLWDGSQYSKKQIMVTKIQKAQPEIKVRGKTLEQVESFKYLGNQITKDGRQDTEKNLD